MEVTFEHNRGNLRSMLAVDFRRMFTMRLFYIVAGVCLVIPILILVMTTTMDGSVSVDPQTGVETVAEGFSNVWQIIGTVGGGGTAAGMDMMSMCNINLLYFGAAVLVCLFVSEDFKSGYVKNIFAVRTKKASYVISKTLVCFTGCALMLLAFFLGAVVGGAIAGLPFELGSITAANLVMCMLSKIFLMAVFVAIFLVASILAKEKTWLAIVGSFVIGMLLFTMIPAMTPLNATITHAAMCLIGGIAFCAGLGIVSNVVLHKRDIL